ncbi:MAG TPA: hypothetical protein VMJ10_09285 [Kofleriaceae bacterium]|nr:hypothetical protein [Kofleriaceae bacterium]
MLALLAACNDSPQLFAPIIDLPENASAQPPTLDQLTMSVANEGAADDLVSATFTHGQTVELTHVPFGDDLVVHLTGFVSTQEVAYGRTCGFAMAAETPPPVTHLFFASEVKFAQLAQVPEIREGGIAVTYHDGSGLFIGGTDGDGNAVTDVERFDPRTDTLAVLATLAPRTGAVVTQVGTGGDAQVAVIGGIDAGGVGAQIVELIEADNPPATRVDTVADTNMSRTGLTATTLTDGSVIVIGGDDPTMGASSAVDEIQLANGTAEVHPLNAGLAFARYGHTATRLGDDLGAAVLVTGGVDATGSPVAQAELFKPLSMGFLPGFTYQMKYPRAQHQAVLMPDGSVLFIGGIVDTSGTATTRLELFTQDAGFADVGGLPSNAGLVDFAATTLPDGRVLLTGGRTTVGGPPLATAFIAQLDAVDGSVEVIATDSLSTPRAGHQATLLCDGTVLISGGTDDPTAAAERYNPPSLDRR